jgi:short-subunit dehydrogenase
VTSYRKALVTGASSGIGEAFARRLAADGLDLVVVARRVDRLEALAAELPVEVEVLPADLSTADGLDAVVARILRGDIDLVVNNAGFGTTGHVASTEPDRLLAEVQVDVTAVARLTRAALDPMVTAGHGAIINVSSVVSFHPIPLNATYAASKAFVTSFTESVAEEVRPTGVVVQALCPGFTRTEFQSVSGYGESTIPRAFWMSAEAVVARSLRALERGGPVVVVPGWYNRLAAVAARHAPHRLTLGIVATVQRKRR